MLLRQSELFNGMSMEIIRKVMDRAERVHHAPGETLFLSGEKPESFYILINGRVQLTFGADKHSVYVGAEPGEFFGWSALLEREAFTATAECLETTDLLRIGIDDFFAILGNDPEGHCLLYRNLCRALGSRLLHVYEFFTENRT